MKRMHTPSFLLQRVAAVAAGLLLLIGQSAAQHSVYVRGSIFFADSVKGNKYTLELFDAKLTTSLVPAVTLADTAFTVQWPVTDKSVLRLTSPGYHHIELTLNRPKGAPEIQLGQLTLHPLTEQLGEAVVKGKRPVVRTKGSKTTVDVKNSVLSDMGSVRDMLEYVPGLMPDGSGGVKVPGRGRPLIEIDGREVTQQSLLDVLKSDNVDEIEIDRAPSVAYDSDVRAVVRIKTKRGIQDHLYLKVNNEVGYNRRWSDVPSVDFRFKLGKLSSSATYKYARHEGVLDETYIRNIHHPDYTFISLSDAHVKMPMERHQFAWSADWDFTSKQRLSLIYSFNHNTLSTKNSIFQRQTEKDNNEVQKNVYEVGNQQLNLHTLSLSYDHRFSKEHRLLIVADYASTHRRTLDGTEETNLGTGDYSHIRTWGKGHFGTYTGSVRYNVVLPGEIKARVGGKYAYVQSRSDRTSDNPYLDGGAYWNLTRVRNQNASAYLNLSRRWKRVTAEAGLRYEFEHSRIATSGSSDDDHVSNHNSRFTPSLRLTYEVNDDWFLEANYRRYSSRVNYNQLVPSSVYKDSLSYETGNSEVQPSFTHSASVDVTWKDWNLSASYMHTTDEITSAWVNLDNQTNVATYMPFNFSTMKMWGLSLSYNKSIKKLFLYASANVSFPHSRYPFLGEERTADMVSWGGNLNLNYTLNKQWTFYTTFSYESRSEYGITFIHSRNRWDVGVRARFLKNRLTANLVVTDILHGANYNRAMDRFMNVTNGTYGKSDFQGVKLTLAYTIFNKRINVRAQQGNSEELLRTQ